MFHVKQQAQDQIPKLETYATIARPAHLLTKYLVIPEPIKRNENCREREYCTPVLTQLDNQNKFAGPCSVERRELFVLLVEYGAFRSGL